MCGGSECCLSNGNKRRMRDGEQENTLCSIVFGVCVCVSE